MLTIILLVARFLSPKSYSWSISILGFSDYIIDPLTLLASSILKLSFKSEISLDSSSSLIYSYFWSLAKYSIMNMIKNAIKNETIYPYNQPNLTRFTPIENGISILITLIIMKKGETIKSIKLEMMMLAAMKMMNALAFLLLMLLFLLNISIKKLYIL